MHNHWLKNSTKMSKSIGNTVDPIYLINKYSLNAVRYYFLTHGPQNHDTDIEEDKIEDIYYKSIPDVMINLILRVTNIKVMGPLEELSNNHEWNVNYYERILNNMKMVLEIQRFLNKYDFITASIKIHLLLLELNNFVHMTQFWLKADEKKFLAEITCFTLEFLRLTSILLKPFLPELMINIHRFLGLDEKDMKINNCFFRMNNLDLLNQLQKDLNRDLNNDLSKDLQKDVVKDVDRIDQNIDDSNCFIYEFNKNFNSQLSLNGYFNININMKDLIFIKKSKNSNKVINKINKAKQS